MKLKIREIAIFGMLGALMFASKLVMEVLPNMHLVGVFIVAVTVVYRKKALFPIYVFVLMLGVYYGFSLWWVPYLYIWTILWGMVMLLPKNMPKAITPIVYMSICAIHGFLYGTLYAPAQAIMFGFNFEKMIAWIISGLPFDLIHGISNFVFGVLIIPVIRALKISEKYIR